MAILIGGYMAVPGRELYFDSSLSWPERLYCRVFGVPIVGLRIRLRRISRLLPENGDRVLDAGCGRGVISRFLARRYPEAHIDAIDSNGEMQERNRDIAEAVLINNCTFIDADLMSPLPQNHYDLIVSVDNLEHIKDDQALLRNFYVAMSDSGVFILHAPHYYRRWPVFNKTENFDVPGHMRPGYTQGRLQELVEVAGFKVESTGYSYGFLENLSNNLSYMITKAEQQNKLFYALCFPILNVLAWCGQGSNPQFGAGVWLVARK